MPDFRSILLKFSLCSDTVEDMIRETPPLDQGQRRQLAERYGLSSAELGKLLDDIWLLTAETTEAYVLRRHGELRSAGMVNERSFELIAKEIAAGRFASPPPSVRQIRRILYG